MDRRTSKRPSGLLAFVLCVCLATCGGGEGGSAPTGSANDLSSGFAMALEPWRTALLQAGWLAWTPTSPLAQVQGLGRMLYALNGSDLLRFNRKGDITHIGSGFSVGPSSGTGFVFGPDEALYVSEYNENRILKISRGNR